LCILNPKNIKEKILNAIIKLIFPIGTQGGGKHGGFPPGGVHDGGPGGCASKYLHIKISVSNQKYFTGLFILALFFFCKF
jgi:hypothetical protein